MVLCQGPAELFHLLQWFGQFYKTASARLQTSADFLFFVFFPPHGILGPYSGRHTKPVF